MTAFHENTFKRTSTSTAKRRDILLHQSGGCTRADRKRTLHDLGGSVDGILGGFLQMVSAFEVRKNLPRH
jgi:hypothetical protein